MRSVSRGDTKNVCLLFNSLLPPKRERKEREKGGKMSLFSLKKHSLSLSLSLSLPLFLFLSSIYYVLAVDSFFFSSLFVHFFSYWVRSSSVGLLSLFFPFLGRSETTSSVCLSLSLLRSARVLENPISLSDAPRHTKRERDDHL